MPSERNSAAAIAATVAPSRAARSTSVSRAVSGDSPTDEAVGGQRRVDHAQAGVHPADGVGELAGGRVLDDEPARAGLQRPPQVAGPPERGHDEHPHVRQRRAQRLGGGDPVQAGHLDVEQRDVRPVLAGGVAPPRRRGPPRRRPRGRARGPSSAASAPRTSAWSSASSSRIVIRASRSRPPARSPAARAALVTSVAPDGGGALAQPGQPVAAVVVPHGLRCAPRRRRRRPRPARPSGARCTGVAPLCRITLVTPSRTAHANSSRRSLGTSSALRGQVGVDPGRAQRRARPGQLAGQGQLAVALDGAPDVGQRVAREPLEVGDLRPGPGGVDVDAAGRPARP